MDRNKETACKGMRLSPDGVEKQVDSALFS
jgi:hypothetical protein